jgi:hypothetical protein
MRINEALWTKAKPCAEAEGSSHYGVTVYVYLCKFIHTLRMCLFMGESIFN